MSALLAIAAPHIDMQLVALGIAILAICLGISLWNGARATTRLRSKISKLEKEILSLQSRPSPALKEVTHRDQVLVAVYEAGEDDSKLSEVTQLSQARVDDCLHELVKAGMIDQIMEPWETPHHVVIPKGRKYLLNNHLIE
ncbi:hypothetical protein HZ994_09360 [Akkermansiaceae bacterium]|nr:hypothetical protein HZ994_09360 [Akkermansiaceae bacterium]